jgi:PAS domain S-box-containing protein
MSGNAGRRTVLAWGAAIASAIAITALWGWMADREEQRLYRFSQSAARDYIATKRAEIEQMVNRRLFLGRALEGLVRINPAVAHRDFDLVARNLMANQEGIRALQLAPLGRITYVYPIEGNEASLNKDLLSDPLRGPAARRAIQTREFFLAGPFELYQGGLGLVGRVPVFVDSVFWGFTQVVLDFDALIRHAALADTAGPYEFALRGKDELGEAGEVFFGRAEVFGESPVLSRIELPSGSWQLAAVPREGWAVRSRLPFVAYVSAFLITFFSGLLVHLTVRRWFRLRTELEETRDIWRFALEGSGDGVWDWDIPSRRVSLSDGLKSMLGYARDDTAHATSEWESLMHPDDLERSLKAMEETLADENGVYSSEFRVRRKDGAYRWVLTRGKTLKRTPRGVPVRMIGTMSDISERKSAEQAIRNSESRLQEAQALAHVGNWEIDLQTRKIWGSLEAVRIYGLPPGTNELPLELVQRCVHPDHRPRMDVALSDLLTGQSGYDEEFRFQRMTDGMIRWAHSKAEVSRDTTGNPVKIIGVLQDITDRKEAERQIQESEERYRRLVEWAPDAIAVHTGGKFVYVNPAAVRLLGAAEAGDLIGTPVLDVVHPEYRETVRKRIASATQENTPLPIIEEKFVRRDGSVIDVVVFSLPVSYKGVRSMQVVVRDITEQKHLQHQLLQSQKIQSIGTLAAGVAHDFNNLLGIIVGYTELLKGDARGNAIMSERLTAIHKAVERGAGLVRQILMFARQTDTTFSPVDLPVFLREILSMLAQTFPRVIVFTEHFEEGLPPAYGDRTQIHQAVLNLCVNARDAMPGGGSIAVSVRAIAREDLLSRFSNARDRLYLCISVSDNGVGMDEATRSRAFDPFFTTKDKGRGTGLGLSVVYGIAQAHRGFVEMESAIGSGTTVRLYVPAYSEALVPSAPSPGVPAELTGGNETILLVEDEELLSTMVKTVLEGAGYTVLEAKDGLAAVEMYMNYRGRVHLVLTDMGLPKLSGEEEFYRLREFDPSVRVLIASGYVEVEKRAALLAAGAVGFMQKPFTPGDVLLRVRAALDTKPAEGGNT